MSFDSTKVDLSTLSQVSTDETLDDDLNFTMSEAVKINPDEHADVLNLSKRSNIPIVGVQTDPEAVEQYIKKSEFDFTGLHKTNPNTAKYLTDFNNAVIAQDDIDIMKSIEDLFDFSKTFENIGETISLGFSSQGAGLELAGVDMTPDRIDDLIPMGIMPIGMEMEAPMLSRQMAKNMGIDTDEQLQKVKKESTEALITELQGLHKERSDLTPEDLNTLEQGVRAGVESLANMAPGTALMLMTGGRAAPLLTTIGIQTYGDSFGQGRAEGLTPDEAKWFAGIDAFIEVGTELLPTGTLETILTGKSTGLKKSAIKFMIQEMGTEQLATLGQSLNSFAFGLDEQMKNAETAQEMVDIQLQRQAVTAIATVVAGGAQITAATAVRKTIDAVTQDEATKETQGQVEQRKIDTLNEKSAASELRKNDKGAFKQFVEQADGDNNTNVFIDGVQTALYLQDKTLEEIEADPALKMLAAQAREASATGGDVQIPAADFAADIAGSEHFTALRDSMTMSDQTTSPFRQEQVQKETEAYVRTLMDEAQENTSEYVEAQEIYTAIRDQLIDTGQVTAANASLMAQVVPAWATAQARRKGVTVQQVYQDAGLTVEGPQTGERARLEDEQTLSQEPLTTNDLQTQLKDEGIDVQLRGDGEIVTLDKIIVPEGQRESGIGTTAMTRVIDWADANSKTVTLSPTKEFGGNVKRLKSFYKKFGFVENKGKNKDLAISEEMIRLPEDPISIPEEELPAMLREQAGAPDNITPADTAPSVEEFQAFQSAVDQTDTAAFKEWFGNSKVVDENGDPLVVYHGTGSIENIQEFNPALTGQGNDQYGSGFYFTTNTATASGYATDRLQSDLEKLGGEDSPGVLPVYLSVQNPIQVTGEIRNLTDVGLDLSSEQVRKMLNHADALNRSMEDENMNPLGDHFDSFWETGAEAWMIDDIAEKYSGDMVEAIEVELFDNDSKAFREALSEVTGYDGVEITFTESGEKHVVAWFPEQVKSAIGNTGAFDPADPKILNQPASKTKARGYYEPKNSIIRLNEAADLSTFLHEFAHFMYEMELNSNTDMIDSINSWYKRNAKDVAKEANNYLGEKFDALKQTTEPTADELLNIPESELPAMLREQERIEVEPGDTAPSVEEFQAFQPTDQPKAKEGSITEADVIAYLDSKTTGDESKDAAIRRAVHEQFARGFETYLMEGKSPSIELRNAFRAFARWLSRIYQYLRGNLNVKLDDQMRAVFDRLLATEEQIQAAAARARVAPLFTDAAMAGMTEAEFADYQTRQEKVKDAESETLRDKLIKQLTRQTQAWWKEEKQDLIDEEMSIISKDKVYKARAELKDGAFKIDHAAVKAMAGEQKTDKLGRTSTIVPPALRGMTAKGMAGVHPDEAAAFFGYGSGSEMVIDLVTAPTLKDAAAVKAEARMIERHGDILNDGTIQQEADEAVQSEERGRLILHELKMIARGTTAPTVDRATIKSISEERIGRLSFREIHPGKYRKAEIRAAQEAARMLAEGNKEGAAAAKMRQVMNYYLGMAAMNAKNETVKIVDRMARYNKKKVRESIMKVEGGYWDQIVKILDRFEFKKSATLTQVESINTWAKERMESAGDGLVLSDAVLNESFVTHWKNVPFSDLQGVNDSVKNIEHVARYADKMIGMQEEITYNKLKARWIDHISEQEAKFKTKENRSRIDDSRKATAAEHIQRWLAQLTKVPFMASWLDGGERAGMSHDILVQPFTDALDAKMTMVDEVATPVIKAIAERSKEDIARHSRKIFIPEIEDTLGGDQVLAVALNTGNQGNLKKLLLGEGWANPENEADISFDNPKLQAVLAHMTRSDWNLVQQIWDQMDSLYPQLAEVHRRTTGLTPPKVEATPIENEFGTFRGGYYPVKYSPKRSHKAERNAEKRDAETESMFNNTASIQASVNTGATNERTGFYDRIFLSLDVVPDHFNETIHYITHHDAVRQVNRLIQAPDVANAITAVMGEAEFRELKPWLNDIAKDGRQQPVKTYVDEAFHRLRFGTTLGVMGFKATTGIMQLFGIFTTASELGVGPTIKGVQTAVGKSFYMKAVRNLLGSRDDMQTGWDFAAERSKVLPHRVQTMDREIKNAMSRLSKKSGKLAAIQEASMKHIALIQTYMIDLPTWHAAYMKHLSENGDERQAINFADVTLENTQGSGATKDMARIMRNQSKIHTTFTMFMTFFSSLGNLTRDLIRGTKSGQYSPTSAAAKTMFLFTLPVFFEMLMRGELNEPDDGEDDRMSKFLTASMLYPLTSVPFVRDVASGALSDFGYNSSPVAAMMERGLDSGKAAYNNFANDEEITKSQIKNVSKLTGAAIGVPGVNQMWSTGEHLYEVIEEGEDFTTRELLFGPDRD